MRPNSTPLPASEKRSQMPLPPRHELREDLPRSPTQTPPLLGPPPGRSTSSPFQIRVSPGFRRRSEAARYKVRLFLACSLAGSRLALLRATPSLFLERRRLNLSPAPAALVGPATARSTPQPP